MNSREIEFIFPKSNVSFSATLLDDQAPDVCNAVWSVLGTGSEIESVEHWPEKGLVKNGRWAGPEFFVFIPTGKSKPPVQNQTFRPIPGDVLFFTPPTAHAYPGLWESGFRRELWQFGVTYDRDSDIEVKHGPDVTGVGWIGSRFAKVYNKELDVLLDMGNSIWTKGPERVIVRRKTKTG
jgi:Protein of unknown function (DUF3830)